LKTKPIPSFKSYFIAIRYFHNLIPRKITTTCLWVKKQQV
jgi:hypothetical protein